MFAGKTRIYAATAPIDLRRSVDGLAAAARDQMGHDPQSGSLFLFVNRPRQPAEGALVGPHGVLHLVQAPWYALERRKWNVNS